jgi:LmbE family N-acetylglucosaminyl deacetylase
MNILAIGAHPDDIELGCGGLLLKAAMHGHNVFMYILTHGARSGNPKIRIQEQIYSSKFIRAKALWIDNFEDTKLCLNDKLINHIEFMINKAKADIVYVPCLHDAHHDHRAIAESTLEAGRYVSNILSYEMPVTKEFKPQVFYDISDVINGKMELINIFLSQKNKLFIKSDAIRGLAQYRALQSRLDITAVEAFEVLKISFEQDFQLLKRSCIPPITKIDISNNEDADVDNSILKEILVYSPAQDLRFSPGSQTLTIEK